MSRIQARPKPVAESEPEDLLPWILCGHSPRASLGEHDVVDNVNVFTNWTDARRNWRQTFPERIAAAAQSTDLATMQPAVPFAAKFWGVPKRRAKA